MKKLQEDDDNRCTEDNCNIIDQPFLQWSFFLDAPDVVEYALDVHEKADHAPKHDGNAGDNKDQGMNILDVGLRKTHDGIVYLRLSREDILTPRENIALKSQSLADGEDDGKGWNKGHEGVESELGSEAPVTVDKKILVEQITTLEQISSEVFPPRQTVAGLHLVLELTDDVANVHIQLLHTGLVTIARVVRLSISCGKKRCHDLGYRL